MQPDGTHLYPLFFPVSGWWTWYGALDDLKKAKVQVCVSRRKGTVKSSWQSFVGIPPVLGISNMSHVIVIFSLTKRWKHDMNWFIQLNVVTLCQLI